MPLWAIILLGAALVGGGIAGYEAYKTQKELEWKKSYSECVKLLVEKYNLPPEKAKHFCNFEDIRLDLVNIALFGAAVSATLIGVKILMGGSKCQIFKEREQTKV